MRSELFQRRGTLTTHMRGGSVCLFAVLMLATTAQAENWPGWRGPRGDGTSTEKNLPIKWSKTENVAWRLALPGAAGATPVIWNDRIFLTSVDGDDLVLISASTDGKELWKKPVATGNRKVRGDEGNLASPSPVTDGKHVWTFMAQGTLACFDFSGNEVWRTHLPDRYGKFNDVAFGMSSTPVLDAGRLYMQLMWGGGSFVLALDAKNGEEVWKHVRVSNARAECKDSYASPFMYHDKDRKFLLTHGADYIIAHDLADGHEIFRCGGLNPPDNYNPTLRLVASPVGVPGVIVVPSAKNGPVLGISPDAKGDITGTDKFHLWTRAHNTPDVPSPVIHDGLLYLCRENSNLICLNAMTGKEVYGERRTHVDRCRASPVYADGHLYITSRDGTVSVIKAGADFEIVSTNKLEESISSSPAFSGGKIYFRSYDALWAIGPVK